MKSLVGSVLFDAPIRNELLSIYMESAPQVAGLFFRRVSRDLEWLMYPLRMVDHIVLLLIQERDKLNRAIQALQGSVKRRGRPPGSGRRAAPSNFNDVPDVAEYVTPTVAKAPAKRGMSPAGRKAIGDAARKRWAAIKAGKAPSPFAKKAKDRK